MVIAHFVKWIGNALYFLFWQTKVALGPGYGACFVAKRDGDEWKFATSYDRELVVECALLLMARLPPAPPRR